MNYYLIFLKLCNELLSVLSGGRNVDPPDFFIGSDDPVTGNALGVFDNAVDSYLFALGNGCSPVDVLGKCIQIRLLLQGDRDGLTAAGRIREDGIYGVRTVYYGFGAGVPTGLEEGQILTYGEDGSMIISGFDVKMDDLIYRVGTVSDHILAIKDGSGISLRDLCGRNARVGFYYEPREENG